MVGVCYCVELPAGGGAVGTLVAVEIWGILAVDLGVLLAVGIRDGLWWWKSKFLQLRQAQTQFGGSLLSGCNPWKRPATNESESRLA